MDKRLRTLVFLLRDGEILLALKKRGFGAGHWNGVGGKLEADETIEQATIRECQEEIGVTPTHMECFAVHHFKFEEQTDDLIVHAYLCWDWEGTPVETEEMAPKWFDINSIPYLEMWEDDIYWLPAVLAGQKLNTTFTFDASFSLTEAHITPIATDALQ